MHLPAAMTPSEVGAIRETIWHFIEARTSIQRNDPSTWPHRFPPGLSFKSLQGRAVFGPLVENDALQAVLAGIFGPDGWVPPARRGRVLWTFPREGPWVMPTSWHMDGDFGLAAFPVPGVQLWALVDDLAPCGGGTLLLAGSHLLVDEYSKRLAPAERGGNSVTWGRFLKQHPVLDELRRGGTRDHPRREILTEVYDVDGVSVKPIEVTGRAGDMYVSHIHVFHSPAPNTGLTVRQMLTGGIGGRDHAVVPVP